VLRWGTFLAAAKTPETSRKHLKLPEKTWKTQQKTSKTSKNIKQHQK